jgi:hypothetical protein
MEQIELDKKLQIALEALRHYAHPETWAIAHRYQDLYWEGERGEGGTESNNRNREKHGLTNCVTM